MSAKPTDKGWFHFDSGEATADKPALTVAEIDAFNAKYGQMVHDLHMHLCGINDAQEYYMLCKAINAVIGISTQERLKGLADGNA